ncbi:MAG: hypothetical protein ACQEVT_14745, partial [Pseudomonadota bacterium]
MDISLVCRWLMTVAWLSLLAFATPAQARSVENVGLCNKGEDSIQLASLLISDGLLKNRAMMIAFEEMRPGDCWTLNQVGSGFAYQMYEAVAVAIFQKDARGVLGNPRYGFDGLSQLGSYKWAPKTICLEPNKSVSTKGTVQGILSQFTGSCSGNKIPAQVSFAVKPRDQRVRLTIAPQKQEVLRPWQSQQSAPVAAATPPVNSKTDEETEEERQQALIDVWVGSQVGYRRNYPIMNPHITSLSDHRNDNLTNIDTEYFSNKGFYAVNCIAQAQIIRDLLSQFANLEEVAIRRGFRDGQELIEDTVFREHLAFAEWDRQLDTLADTREEREQWSALFESKLQERMDYWIRLAGGSFARLILDKDVGAVSAAAIANRFVVVIYRKSSSSDLCRKNNGGFVKT